VADIATVPGNASGSEVLKSRFPKSLEEILFFPPVWEDKAEWTDPDSILVRPEASGLGFWAHAAFSEAGLPSDLGRRVGRSRPLLQG
jgi:hypothetical protein